MNDTIIEIIAVVLFLTIGFIVDNIGHKNKK